MSKDSATAGRKNVLFTGKNLQQNLAQEEEAMCCWGVGGYTGKDSNLQTKKSQEAFKILVSVKQ